MALFRRAIVKLEADRDVSGLVRALGRRNRRERAEAALALGRSPDTRRLVEPLIAALQDEDWGVREAAASSLGRIGDTRAVAPLIKALQDAGSSAAAKALGQIGDVRAVDPLLSALKGGSGREAAASALGGIGDARAVDGLVAALTDADPGVREGAVAALGQIGDRSSVGPLTTALIDSSCNVRTAATAALDRLNWDPGGDAAGATYWLATLCQPAGTPSRLDREAARSRALPGLLAVGAPAVRPLIAALHGSDSFVQQVAVEALVGIGSAAVEPLIASLRGEEWCLNLAHSEALARTEGGRVVEIYLACQPDVRAAAARALGQIADVRAVAPLMASLVGEVGSRAGLGPGHSAVAAALVNIGTRAVRPLAAELNNENPQVRRAVVEAIGQIGDRLAVTRLLPRLKDKDVDVRASAARALGLLGDVRAVAALLFSSLHDGESSVRLASIHALEQFRGEDEVQAAAAAIAVGDQDRVVRAAAASLIVKVEVLKSVLVAELERTPLSVTQTVMGEPCWGCEGGDLASGSSCWGGCPCHERMEVEVPNPAYAALQAQLDAAERMLATTNCSDSDFALNESQRPGSWT